MRMVDCLCLLFKQSEQMVCSAPVQRIMNVVSERLVNRLSTNTHTLDELLIWSIVPVRYWRCFASHHIVCFKIHLSIVKKFFFFEKLKHKMSHTLKMIVCLCPKHLSGIRYCKAALSLHKQQNGNGRKERLRFSKQLCKEKRENYKRGTHTQKIKTTQR